MVYILCFEKSSELFTNKLTTGVSTKNFDHITSLAAGFQYQLVKHSKSITLLFNAPQYVEIIVTIFEQDKM